MDETPHVNVNKIRELFLSRRFSNRSINSAEKVKRTLAHGKVAAIVHGLDGDQK